MSPELLRDIKDIVKLVVVTVLMWLAAHGYIKKDIDDAVQTGVEQVTAQTDEQTETMKAEAKKTRQKVVEETNEVSATAEKVATELVEAVPMRAQATDPAIAELLGDLVARLEKIEKERVEGIQ